MELSISTGCRVVGNGMATETTVGLNADLPPRVQDDHQNTLGLPIWTKCCRHSHCPDLIVRRPLPGE